MIIAICDPGIKNRNELVSFFNDYKKSNRINFDIAEFCNSDSLLKYERKVDLLFINCKIADRNGLETAKILRNNGNNCGIIFISEDMGSVIDTFEVSAFDYLMTPIDRKKLTMTVDRFIKNYQKSAPIVVRINGDYYSIDSNSILYIEGNGKYCHIRTTDDIINCSKTISCILEKLPSYCFFRTHKSYAINMYYIKKISNNHVILSNGEKAQISRYRELEFKKAYENFVVHFTNSI